MEGVKLIPHDEVQKRTVKKIVAVPVLHGFGKKLGKSSRIVPQERIFDRVVGHIISGTHGRSYESHHHGGASAHRGADARFTNPR